MFEINSVNVGYIITFLINLFLASYILSKSRNRASRIFVWLQLSIAFWVLCNFFADNLLSLELAKISAKLAIVGPISIGPIFFLFANSFVKKKISNLSKIIMILSTVALLILVPTNLNIEEISKSSTFGVSFTPGILYMFLLIHLLLHVFTSVFVILTEYKKLSMLEKAQLKFIAIGFVLTLFLALFTTGVLPILGISEFSFMGPSSTIIFSAFVTVTLVKYRLFDIRAVLSKVLYFVIMGFIPYIAFYFFNIIYVEFFGSIYDPVVLVIGFGTSVLFVYVILLINNKISVFIQKSFLDPGLDSYKAKEELITHINKVIDIDQVLSLVSVRLASILNVTTIHIALNNRESSSDESQLNISTLDMQQKEVSELAGIIYGSKDILGPSIVFVEEFIQNKRLSRFISPVLSKTLSDNRVDIIFNFPTRTNRDIMFFLCGLDKSSNIKLSDYEIDIIESVGYAIELTIDRALLFQEVQEFNKTLQDKVDKATEELQVKNVQLEDALRKERDLMDVIGHELRTPLGNARNAIVLLEVGAQKGTLTNEKIEKYTKIAAENIRREKDLLESILQSARLENDRMTMNIESVDLDDVINDSLVAFEEEARRENLTLIIENNATGTFIKADRTAIQQVSDNLLSNAIKYTEKGTVTVKTEVREGKVWFGVIDTGEGISKEDLPSIGKKFFRAVPYLDTKGRIDGQPIVRPGGTGIGLYVVKGLLTKMGSELIIDTELGVGSTFSFEIDIAESAA